MEVVEPLEAPRNRRPLAWVLANRDEEDDDNLEADDEDDF
jgi:hypothetical protein